MNSSIVKSVQVVNQKRGSEYGQMIIEFENGLEITRTLSKTGKYQFVCGKLFANCIPTIESVQNAINYVGADSDCLAAQPKRGGHREGAGRKPGTPMTMFYIRVPTDLKEKLSKIDPEKIRIELSKITAPQK